MGLYQNRLEVQHRSSKLYPTTRKVITTQIAIALTSL